MQFLKNKHVIVAMIVAPLLAVMSYFAVDALVGEKPHVAVSGQAYPLVAQSNCRYTSGACDLENASFRSTISFDEESKVLLLESSHALQNATIGFLSKENSESVPVSMLPVNAARTQWRLDTVDLVDENSIARIALQANDAFYYAETGMSFIEYKTGFEKDFRNN